MVKQKKLFKVGGNHETWHKDALRDGGVKLIRSHVKVDVKECQISAFRIIK